MKKIIVLFISAIMLNSCNSQNNIDLLDLPLPLGKEILINEKYTFKVGEQFPGLDYYKASSFDPNLMYASGEAINNSEKYPLELITFFDSKTDKVIGYNLRMNTTKAAKQFEKLLKDKYSTPNYYRSLSSRSTSIWDDSNNNSFVFFEHYYPSEQKKEHGSNLFVFNLKPLDIVEQLSTPTMSYYLGYLNNRKSVKQTFREYAEYKAKELFSDRYLKAISNPYKH